MARGGKREKAGRKSTWASGCKFEDTKLIRVPAAIADHVLAIAHQIDAGQRLINADSKVPESNEDKTFITEQLSFLESQDKLVKVPLAIEARVTKYIENLKYSLESKKSPRNKFGLLCPECKSDDICKHGFAGNGSLRKQVYKCKTCSRRFTS